MQKEHGQTWSLYGGNCLSSSLLFDCAAFLYIFASLNICASVCILCMRLVLVFADIVVDSHWIAATYKKRKGGVGRVTHKVNVK